MLMISRLSKIWMVLLSWASSVKKGPSTVASVAPGGLALFIILTRLDTPRVSDSKINSAYGLSKLWHILQYSTSPWCRSVHFWPVAVKKLMAVLVLGINLTNNWGKRYDLTSTPALWGSSPLQNHGDVESNRIVNPPRFSVTWITHQRLENKPHPLIRTYDQCIRRAKRDADIKSYTSRWCFVHFPWWLRQSCSWHLGALKYRRWLDHQVEAWWIEVGQLQLMGKPFISAFRICLSAGWRRRNRKSILRGTHGCWQSTQHRPVNTLT